MDVHFYTSLEGIETYHKRGRCFVHLAKDENYKFHISIESSGNRIEQPQEVNGEYLITDINHGTFLNNGEFIPTWREVQQCQHP